MSTAPENYTSDQYDQTAILAELDRVLRSTNLAERCEGIVRLPQHFEKYPFPVFITAAFLRLVEAFRSGTNLTRKWILHVAERSEKHLDKVISRDELMKRILTVSHSNDPNARALTMKLFAYFARILADRKQMHHLICTSLDSNDIGELHAAIFAAQRFAKQSPEFGRSVFDKVVEMLMSIDVPPETKLLLVPIFEHFYSNAVTSQKAIVFCRDQFLPQCHSSTITGAVLTSLTKLAVNAVVIGPVQLSLLLSHLNSRRISKRVILTTLDCLHYLARETPHLWTPDALKVLCDVCDGSGDAEDIGSLASMRALRVLATLTKSYVVRLWGANEIARIVDLCSKRCYDNSNLILSISCVVAVNMVENLEDGPSRNQLLDTLTIALTMAIPIWPWHSDEEDLLIAAKSILKCTLKLAKIDSATAQTLAQCLVSVVGMCSSLTANAINECILALCDADLVVAEQLQQQQFQSPVSDGVLRSYLMVAPKSSVALINQVPASMGEWINGATEPWQLYQLGRRALRYGYSTVAMSVFENLQTKALSDHYVQWIKSLAIVATAEDRLGDPDLKPISERLRQAVYHHHLALIHMMAAVTTGHSLWFPIAFVQLRQEFLNAVKDLHTTWDAAVLVPPSTSVAADASTSADSKVSRLATQLSDFEKRFGEISSSYDGLTRRCFDADDGTIQLLKLLRMQCFLVQQAISLLVGNRERKVFSLPESTYNAQTRIVSRHLGWMSKELATMQTRFEGISKEAMEYLMAVVDHITLEVPFVTPRFFFQSLQTSNVKLVLSPKPTERDNTFRIPSDQRLLLNVEGVVTVTTPKGRVFRKVERVVIRVVSEFVAGSQSVSDVKPRSKSPENGTKLEKTVRLQNDYFSADFILDFPTSGSVNVHVDLIDDVSGIVWDGNADEQLRVKVLPVAGSSDATQFPRSGGSGWST